MNERLVSAPQLPKGRRQWIFFWSPKLRPGTRQRMGRGAQMAGEVQIKGLHLNHILCC